MNTSSILTSNRFSALSLDAPAPDAEFVLEELVKMVHRVEKKAPSRIIGNGNHSLIIPVQLKTLDTGRSTKENALIDSGATGSFLDKSFVLSQNWNMRQVENPVKVLNVDGSENAAGSISQAIDLEVMFGEHREKMTFGIVNLGKTKMILGHDWLKRHNPSIDWEKSHIDFKRCPPLCRQARKQLPAAFNDQDEENDNDETLHTPEEVISMISDKDDEQVFFTMIGASETISQRLHREAMSDTNTNAGILPEQYREFSSVFSKSSFDQLPLRRSWDHAIELEPGSKPKFCKVYPLNLDEQKQLDDFIEENLATGRIHPSKSPMASPVFFIKKKDGSLRLVQDYRALNEMTIKNRYPIPLISELVNKLRKAKYFTALDVRWGYNNIRIKEGDEWKAAFRTNRGLFEPTVMFFGLCNSPATFQTMMNELFRELITEGVVVVYIDDILIFTETFEEHEKIVRRVLKILQDNELYLKLEKCFFHKQELDYLGLKISQNSIAMDPIKVQGVTSWHVPKNKKDVQTFLGFVNFYRRFIKDFAKTAHPLHKLTGNLPWEWNDEHQSSFDQLKKAVTEAPVLRMPTDDGQFRVEADASDFATGAVLSQFQGDNWYPIAYLSKSLSEPERNYDIYDKELLAIIRALDEWRHFLEGAQQKFEIWTDHKNLQYFRTAQKLNRRQARWSLFLSRFDFLLHHRPGKTAGKPDALSRQPNHVPEGQDNVELTLLKPEWFARIASIRGHVEVQGVGDKLLLEIKKDTTKEESVLKALGRRDPRWSKEADLLMYKGLVYVPPTLELRRKVMQQHHDSQLAGHPGQYKTLELITRNYWWPSMKKDIQNYVRTCVPCQRTKTFPAKPPGYLQPNSIPQVP